MKVARWGNSLAVRLPADVVKKLGLKEGDEVELIGAEKSSLKLQRQRTREEALERLTSMRLQLPDDWKFDRDEANTR